MLKIQNLSFAYNQKNVLEEINFTLERGQHLSIIGESGSGKSTLLKLIYGEFDLKEGSISWKKTPVLGPKHNLVIGYDFMKYVAQEFDLMPFISVEENVGKYLSNFFPDEKKERVVELLSVVELSDFSKIKVKSLSGGQKQRVALARAIAKQPEIILLDEPFSHIDNFKKRSLRRRLFKYLKDNNISCIVATHDKDDVLGYANKMVVLHDSNIIAYDTPEQLYANPQLPLIASFFKEYNVINGEIVYSDQLHVVEKSNLKTVVKNSYFKGDYYLIEAEHNASNLYFEHNNKFNRGTEIYLEIVK